MNKTGSNYIAKNMNTGDIITDVTLDTIREIKQIIDKRVIKGMATV